MSVKKDNREKIFVAFRESARRWRTARGIAKDTGIALPEVVKFLETSQEISRSGKAGSHGQALFALREKRPQQDSAAKPMETAVQTDEQDYGDDRLRYFVLLPLDASMRRLRDTIGRSIREERAEPFFLDEMSIGAAWVDEISLRIRTSDVVIADITRLNPNVMFELGIAHGMGKPLILLLDDDADVDLPTDLVGYQFLAYSPGNLSPFVDRLKRTARQLASRRGSQI